MKIDKRFLIGGILVLIVVGIFILGGSRQQNDRHRQTQSLASGHDHGKTQNGIDYWTCSMHPQVRQDKPGKCPICAMELIPIYKGDKGKIVIDEQQGKYLGIKSVPIEHMHLTRALRLPGKINHDGELYSLQQEYLSLHKSLDSVKSTTSPELLQRQEALIQSIQLRLNLLGIKEEQISRLLIAGEPDKSLIYPTHGKAWVLADIYEQDLAQVKAGQKSMVHVKGYGKDFPGTVYAIEDVLDPRTRSAKARIQITDMDSHIKHETFVIVTLNVDLGLRVALPQTALIDTGTRKVVYIDEGEGRFQMRQIETGVEADGFIEVLKGAAAGEKVVTHGNFLLDSQTTLTGGQSLLYSGSETVESKDK